MAGRTRPSYQCRWCDHAGVCRSEAKPAVNCRTCLHATPVEGGWTCERHQKVLTEADQRAGCPSHLFVPALVPAEQVDAGPDWVDYLFPVGLRWRDRGFEKAYVTAETCT